MSEFLYPFKEVKISSLERLFCSMENEKAILIIYNGKITPMPKPDRVVWKQKSVLLTNM